MEDIQYTAVKKPVSPVGFHAILEQNSSEDTAKGELFQERTNGYIYLYELRICI